MSFSGFKSDKSSIELQGKQSRWFGEWLAAVEGGRQYFEQKSFENIVGNWMISVRRIFLRLPVQTAHGQTAVAVSVIWYCSLLSSNQITWSRCMRHSHTNDIYLFILFPFSLSLSLSFFQCSSSQLFRVSFGSAWKCLSAHGSCPVSGIPEKGSALCCHFPHCVKPFLSSWLRGTVCLFQHLNEDEVTATQDVPNSSTLPFLCTLEKQSRLLCFT